VARADDGVKVIDAAGYDIPGAAALYLAGLAWRGALPKLRKAPRFEMLDLS